MALDVDGTLIWYYNICKREVWLMSRHIIPDQSNENIDLGRFIHEHSYKRNSKEISFGNVKFDVLFHKKNKLIIGETKKSSKYSEASKWQLMYYLKVLEDSGINARGMLLYPEEKKRTDIYLDDCNKEKLEYMIKDTQCIMDMDLPPQAHKINFCRNCAYRDYCYA